MKNLEYRNQAKYFRATFDDLLKVYTTLPPSLSAFPSTTLELHLSSNLYLGGISTDNWKQLFA